MKISPSPDGEQSQQIAKHSSNNEILSTYRPINQIQEAVNRLQSKRNLEKISLDLLQRQAQLDDIHQSIVTSQADIDGRCQRITSLTSQIESAAHLPDLIKRRTTVAELERRLVWERDTLDKVSQQNQIDRDKFDALESELSRLRVSRELIIGTHTDQFLSEQTYTNNRAQIVQALLVKQQRNREKRARRAAKQAKLEAQSVHNFEAQRQAEIIAEEHQKAIYRLRQNHAAVDQARVIIKEEQKAREMKAVANILQLKQSVEFSIEECRRHPRRIKNPGEERQLGNQHREAEIKVREMEIMARLNREYNEDLRLENKRHARAKAKSERQIQQQQQQQRATPKPKCITSNNMFPSQIAVVKTRSFGSGRAPDQVVDMVRRRHSDLVIDPVQQLQLSFPKASDLDIGRIENAVQRRHAELAEGRIKSVCGRQHTGPYFISDPFPVEFVDYIMGEEASVIRFILKNVSYCENAFRFVGLQDTGYREFFEIQYERRGRMSPGIGVVITVLFHGDIQEDLHTNLEFISDIGGAFQIPLNVLMPKSDIILSSTSLNFGRVVIGETTQSSIQLTNRGALGAMISVSFEDNEQCVFQLTNHIDEICGHSTVSLHINYRPEQVNVHHQSTVTILLSNSSNQWASSNTFNVKLAGRCDDVSVFADRNRIDFGCCFIGDLYRDELTLSNRSGSLIRYSVSGACEDVLVVERHHGFLSGSSSSALHFELRPFQDTLEKYPSLQSDRFEIPVEIALDGQDAIKITITGILTHMDVEVKQNLVDFGKCYVGQSVYQDLEVANSSLVMQRYGIISDDIHVSISPNTIHLLPNHTTMVRLTYQPSSQQPVLKSTVLIKSNLGRSRTIRCKGRSAECPLDLSPSTIIMDPCGPDITALSRVQISNKSLFNRLVEFIVPNQDSIPIKISPNVLQLQADQTAEVDIVFKAPAQLEKTEFEQTDLFTAIYDSQSNARYARYVVPVFTRSAENPDHARYQTLYMQVLTSVSESQLELIGSSNVVNFGDIPLLQTSSVFVTVCNKSDTTCPLQISPTITSSAFRLSTDSPLPQALDPGQTVSLVITFRPTDSCEYREKFVISNQIEITLIGIGSPLIVNLEPDNDVIDFGDVLIGDCRTVNLTLKNQSKFAFTFETNFNTIKPESTESILTITPSSQRLASNESANISFVLRPTSDDVYNGEFSLRVAACRYERRFAVKGRSRSRQLFFLLPDGFHVSNALLLPSAPSTYRAQLHVQQSNLDTAVISTSICFGSCQVESMPIKPVPATWEIIVPETAKKGGYLKVVPATGKLAPGELQQIEIQFDRQRWATIYDPIEVISETKELLQCMLQGGWAPPEQSTTVKFELMCNFHLLLN